MFARILNGFPRTDIIRGCGIVVVDSAESKIVPCDRFVVQRTRNRVLLVPMIACPQQDLPLAEHWR